MCNGKSTSHKTHQQNKTQPLFTHFDKRGETEGTPTVPFSLLTTGGSIRLPDPFSPRSHTLHMDMVHASITEYNVILIHSSPLPGLKSTSHFYFLSDKKKKSDAVPFQIKLIWVLFAVALGNQLRDMVSPLHNWSGHKTSTSTNTTVARVCCA